ncbi:MAG: phosphoribosyltransferase [Luteolibacter sp.]
MRKIVVISSEGIRNSVTGSIYTPVIEALRAIKAQGSEILLVSNRERPNWLDDTFDFLHFIECPNRQSGNVIPELIKQNPHLNLLHKEFIILGSSDHDLRMATNSKSLLIRCEWAELGETMAKYGVPWSDPSSLPALISYLDDAYPWHFVSHGEFLDVYALTNAGTHSETDERIAGLINRLRKYLKDRVPGFKSGITLHLLSSIYATPIFEEVELWSYYPSSASDNSGEEVMGELCRRAREIYKKRLSDPVFLRHTASPKRHIVGGDRNDPTSQLVSVHLNPVYRDKIRGKVVAVLDDYLTRGVSFGVSSSLLMAAGAKKVVAVAVGKFGDCSNRYEIDLSGRDVFSPLLPPFGYKVNSMSGTVEHGARLAFKKKFAS